MLEYWRVFLLLTCIFGACLAIGFKPPQHGVEIVYVSGNHTQGLEQGMIISEVNGIKISNVDEWNKQIQNLSGTLRLKVNGKDYIFLANETPDISVSNLKRTNIDFGLDIVGGTRILLKPNENITPETLSQTVSILQTRADIYGLKEIRFYPITTPTGEGYIQVEAAGVGEKIIEDLLSKQGKFEAKISKPIEIKDNKGIIQLGENKYDLTVLGNDTIKVNNSIIKINDSFVLEDIKFEYVNKTLDKVVLLGTVFEGKDIEMVYSDPQHSGIMPYGNGFKAWFVVLISKEGAEKFAKVTSGIPSRIDINTGESYLKDCMIFLYLDNELKSALTISSGLQGKAYTTPQIVISRLDRNEVIQERLKLQTVLRSGALPTTLSIVSIDRISPSLGVNFLSSIYYLGLLAVLAIITVVFIRYRKLKIALPMAFTGISEVIIIIGIACVNDTFIWLSVLAANLIILFVVWKRNYEIENVVWLGAILVPLLGLMSWNIDLSAIGGIIASVGPGMDDMVIIADEALSGRRKVYAFKEGIRRAFFVIFGAGATVIAAMVPLAFIGVGLVRGFAMTTIVGCLVGVLIARPAYAKIIEKTVKVE